MKNTVITNEEWLKALFENGISGISRSDPGKTAEEWAKHLNRSIPFARRIIREGLDRGVVTRGVKTMTDISGRRMQANVYQFLVAKKRK